MEKHQKQTLRQKLMLTGTLLLFLACKNNTQKTWQARKGGVRVSLWVESSILEQPTKNQSAVRNSNHNITSPGYHHMHVSLGGLVIHFLQARWNPL